MTIKRTTNIVSVGLIAAYVLFLLIGWRSFPARIPTHFSASGAADSYGSKTSLLIEPVIMVGLFLLFAVVECFPRTWNIPVQVTQENEAAIFHICTVLFGILKITSILLCAYTGLMCIYPALPSWPMFMLILVLIGSIGWSIYRMFKAR